MEEIRGTGALEREILDDAGKRAGKILRKAREEAEKIARVSAEALEKKRAETENLKQSKMSQLEKESLSTLPLEKTRLRARFVDEALRSSVRRFLDSLDGTARGAWCLSELKRSSTAWAGRKLAMRWRGIDASSLRRIGELLGPGLSGDPVQDPAMSRPGLLLRSLDDTMTMTLTDGLLEARLLDEYRGELARALFPETPGEDARR